jgi:transposase
MVYDKHSSTFYRNKISPSIVGGRIECDFELPADSPTPYEEYVLSEDYEFRTSTLQYDQATDEFYLHVKTRKIDTDGEAVEFEGSDDTEHQTVLGIDLGVNSLAIASTGTFWSGDEYDHWIQEFGKTPHRDATAWNTSRSQRLASTRETRTSMAQTVHPHSCQRDSGRSRCT